MHVHVLAVGTANPAKKKRKTKKSRRTESPPLPPTAGPADSSPLALLPSLSSLPAQLNRVQDAQPDEDGYYTFTVSMWGSEGREEGEKERERFSVL